MAVLTSSETGDGPLPSLRRLAAERVDISRQEAELVRRARSAGYSWEAIAGALGVTKQAAHKRYGKQ